jgi:poly(3-hydroxybutyrate) depolymerase
MQSNAANAWGCWNWFEANTERGAGEAAIVAAQIVEVRRRYRARRERVFVAGLSAGGALAAVLGLRYPRLVRGVFVHSGLACGAAASPASARSVMRKGPDTDVARVADDARVAAEIRSPPDVALLVVHGDSDDVVAPVNTASLVAQYLRFNDLAPTSPHAAPSSRHAISDESASGRYRTHTDDWTHNGRVRVRRVRVEGLGHAWSGGDAAYAYADPRGPDALAILARFIADASRCGRSSA